MSVPTSTTTHRKKYYNRNEDGSKNDAVWLEVERVDTIVFTAGNGLAFQRYVVQLKWNDQVGDTPDDAIDELSAAPDARQMYMKTVTLPGGDTIDIPTLSSITVFDSSQKMVLSFSPEDITSRDTVDVLLAPDGSSSGDSSDDSLMLEVYLTRAIKLITSSGPEYQVWNLNFNLDSTISTIVDNGGRVVAENPLS